MRITKEGVITFIVLLFLCPSLWIIASHMVGSLVDAFTGNPVPTVGPCTILCHPY